VALINDELLNPAGMLRLQLSADVVYVQASFNV
jgi:hypothetical protein